MPVLQETCFQFPWWRSVYTISNYSNSITKVSESELFNTIVSALTDGDEIVLEHEIYYGEFNYGDYIVLNELFKPIQKLDLLFCISIFNGETERFEVQLANSTKQEYYRFSTKDLSYRGRLLSFAKDLELVKLHLEFESLGGSHEIPSRFTELVQRAGWDNGIKMITALLSVLQMLQSINIIGKDNIQTRFADRIHSDDGDIVYGLTLGDEEHEGLFNFRTTEGVESAERVVVYRNVKYCAIFQ